MKLNCSRIEWRFYMFLSFYWTLSHKHIIMQLRMVKNANQATILSVGSRSTTTCLVGLSHGSSRILHSSDILGIGTPWSPRGAVTDDGWLSSSNGLCTKVKLPVICTCFVICSVIGEPSAPTMLSANWMGARSSSSINPVSHCVTTSANPVRWEVWLTNFYQQFNLFISVHISSSPKQ